MDKWMDNFARPPGADQGFTEELARAVTVGLINRRSLDSHDHRVASHAHRPTE